VGDTWVTSLTGGKRLGVGFKLVLKQGKIWLGVLETQDLGIRTRRGELEGHILGEKHSNLEGPLKNLGIITG